MITLEKSAGFAAPVRVATDRLSWISATSRSLPIRWRQHISDERSKVSLCWKNSSPLLACEIAGLDWSMVLDAQGRVSGTIHVRDVIAKKRGGRRIPMHPDLRRALERLARTTEPLGR
jgi:hypothetical protein